MRTRGHAEVVVVFFSEDLRPLLHVALRVSDLHVIVRVSAAPRKRDDMIQMPGAADLLLADPADALVSRPDDCTGDLLGDRRPGFRPASAVIIPHLVGIILLPGFLGAVNAVNKSAPDFRTAGSAGSAFRLSAVVFPAEPPPVRLLPA